MKFCNLCGIGEERINDAGEWESCIELVKTCIPGYMICRQCEKEIERRPVPKKMSPEERRHNKLFKAFQQDRAYPEIKFRMRFERGGALSR